MPEPQIQVVISPRSQQLQPAEELDNDFRKAILDASAVDWSTISPAIFGSMFQAIVTPGARSDLGQHYTSVPNILKTIEPLFLDSLKEQFDAGFDSVRKLEALLEFGGVRIDRSGADPVIEVDGMPVPLNPETCRLLVPTGGLKGYESH